MVEPGDSRAGAAGGGETLDPRLRLRVMVVAAVLFVLVTAVMVGKLHHGDYKDAEVWYDVGRRVLAGEALVGLLHYRYPPTFAVLVAPLCLLPFPVFFLLWHVINVGLFVLSLRLAARLIEPGSRWADLPRQWAPAALVLVFSVDNLFLGQTNILVMALLYWMLLELERNREWRAGIPLAAAIAIKVFPAPLLAYLVYRARLRAVASTLLACVVFFLLLPAPIRGFQRNLREVGDWGDRVVMPYLSRGKAGDWGQHALDFGNQSLQAVAHRYLRPVDARVLARRSNRSLYVNLARLTTSQVNNIVLGAFLLLAASFLWACGRRRPRDAVASATEGSLAIILVILASALAWTYFFVMLLLPLAVALHLLRSRRDLRSVSRRALGAGLWALALAIVLLPSSHARAAGSLFWATLVLYAGLALACRDLRGAGLDAAPRDQGHD